MAWDRPALINLREILARLYPSERDARRVVIDAGLDPGMIAFDSKAINNWFAILEEAGHHAGKIDALTATCAGRLPGRRRAAGRGPRRATPSPRGSPAL